MRYTRERRKALIVSALLHGVLFLLVFFGLPELFSHKPEPEPLVLTVDILPVKDITNVPTSLEKPTPEPKKEEKKEEAKKPTPHVVTQETPPPPLPQENPAPPKPEPKKEEVKKPEEKPKKEKKPPPDDLLAVLKAVKQEAQKEESKKPKKEKEPSSSSRTHSEIPYNPNLPLSVTVKDAIRQQLYKCWSVDAGAKDAYKLIVTIDIWLNKDGSLVDEQYTKDTQNQMAASPEYRAAAERAYRAIKLCSPLTGLPPDKYEAWSYMEFTFDPRDMLY